MSSSALKTVLRPLLVCVPFVDPASSCKSGTDTVGNVTDGAVASGADNTIRGGGDITRCVRGDAFSRDDAGGHSEVTSGVHGASIGGGKSERFLRGSAGSCSGGLDASGVVGHATSGTVVDDVGGCGGGSSGGFADTDCCADDVRECGGDASCGAVKCGTLGADRPAIE